MAVNPKPSSKKRGTSPSSLLEKLNTKTDSQKSLKELNDRAKRR